VSSLRRIIKVFPLPLIFFFLFPFAARAGAYDGQDIAKTSRRIANVAIARASEPGPGPAPQAGGAILRISVEVVSDAKARERGLSGREGLAEDSGMLFVLDEGRPAAFWMKGMRFPLDLLYFDKNRRLIKILSGLQPCTDCPIYRSPDDTAYVLEVAAGAARKYGIRTGDFLTYTDQKTGEQAP
jgi:uncharacterized protein